MPGGGWVEDFSAGTVKIIGAFEALAAVGLILPPRSTSHRFLCRWLRWGDVADGRCGDPRLRRHEVVVVVDLVYLAMAAFVAWGRFGPESFTG